MRLGMLGSISQVWPGSEGYVLWQSDLIDTQGEPWEVEIVATDRLRSMFDTMPAMSELYPVLVELVVYYGYRGIPGFADVDSINHQLAGLGITSSGLAMLHRRVRQHMTPVF
jgi:hypothetical protein